MSRKGFALASFLFVLGLCLSGCGGIATPASLSVAVTAASTTVDATDATTLTAVVTNDKNAAGVTWSVSGGGTLSNTTTSTATYTAPAASSTALTITVTATSVSDATKTGTATITVPAAPSITALTSAQQSVAVGTAYSATLAGSGGVTPYKSWALASGSGGLPPCLTLSSAGVLASPSTPTASCVGVYGGIKFTMSDSGTPNALTATSAAQTITVTGPTIAFPGSLASGQVGTPYSASAAASGALGTTTYSLASGALPASGDLVLNTSSGAITGTPKAADAGTYRFTVTVVDAYGDTATSGALSITINAVSAIHFGVAPTSTATDGVKYSSAIAASGGAGALTYSLVGSGGSNLPSDFTLNPSTGAVAGTPSNLNSFTFEVQAADAYGDTPATQSYTVTVSPGVASKVAFTTEPPSSGTAGTAFGAVVQVEDVNGFLVTSTASVTITSTATGVTGTTTVAAVNGVATFSNLILNTSGAYTLTAASGGLTSATSTGIAIGAGTPSQLAFTTEPPSSGTAGTAFSPQWFKSRTQAATWSQPPPPR
jgi:hypothetical protein